MTNDELLSKTISYLRFPLTIGVVFIHFNMTKGLNINGVKYGLGNPDWYFYILNFIGEVLARLSVPLFFVISGFLFFYRNDFNGKVYLKKLKSRFTTLLIPFILWNVIAIIWKLKYLIPGISSFYRPLEIHLSVNRLINTFIWNTPTNGVFVGPPLTEAQSWYNPIDGPLWYVRELMVMVVLSPVIFFVLKKMGAYSLVIIGLGWFISSSILPKGCYAQPFVLALFFFSYGAFLSIKKRNMVLSFRKYRFAPALYVLFAITDTLTKGYACNGYIHNAGILLGVVSLVVVVSYLLEKEIVKLNSTLANSSFFIFALHGLFIGDLGKFAFTMLHIPENNPYAMLALYISVPFFTVIICFSLYTLIKQYMPKLCNLLTGGR